MKTSYFFKSAVLSALCFASLQMNAQTVIDGVAYKVVDGVAETCYLPGDVKYTAATITIKANVTIDGTSYAVKKIGDSSMRENPNLITVTIPEGVEIIGNSSFAQCPVLPTVVLPATVKTIEDWAFYGCTLLTSINIPDGVTVITEHTFQSTGLTKFVLPASVTTIDVCAFQSSPLADINLENVIYIKGWAFAQTKLASVVAPKVIDLGANSLYECFELENASFPIAETLGGGVFTRCGKLTSASIPKSQNTGNESFKECILLTKVDISSATNIGDWAFTGCAALTSLTIPNTVVMIGSWSLEKTGLTEIFISWDEAAKDELFLGENAFGEGEGKSDFTWKVPASLKDVYGDEWEEFPVEVGVPAGIVNNQADAIDVYYNNGSLTLVNLDGQNVSVISLDGRIVANFNVEGADAQVPVSLNAGVYIVRAASASAKFIVR